MVEFTKLLFFCQIDQLSILKMMINGKVNQLSTFSCCFNPLGIL